MEKNNLRKVWVVFLTVFCLSGFVFSQTKDDKSEKNVMSDEHDSNIYGVKLGMDVPTALEAVFTSANRKPGQEKPDAMKKDSPKKNDIRVVYKNLPKGELQIVFDQGKFVKEIILQYAEPVQISELKLPASGDGGEALSGQRLDDRYSVGFSDNKRLQSVWWRDEKSADDYSVRILFTSTNRLKDAQSQNLKVMQKGIFITPGDEQKFADAMNKKSIQ